MAKRVATDGLLLAISLILFIIELQIPELIPVPGIKIGLANIITVYAMFAVGAGDTFIILISRIILGCIISGQITAFMFSLAGGILCYLGMLLLKKILTRKQIWICSIIGAILHNIGQIIIAMIILRTFEVISYLPLLIIAAIITGLFTGIIAQLLVKRFGIKTKI